MGLLDSLFGKKPEIPKIPGLESSQTGAIKANVASFEDIAALATQVDAFNQSQLEGLMERTLPGGRAKIQEIISSRLAGEIPDDVARAMRRAGAERGVGGGFGGSDFSRNLTARDLGLTSLAVIDSGLASAESWLAGAKSPNFDVASMFITPQQKYQSNINQFNRDLMEAKIDAAPDPGTRGLFDASMQLTGMILSAYGGGAGYTGTYKGEQGGGGFGGGGFGGTDGPGGFYMGGNNWGFGRTQNQPGVPGGGNKWFIGKRPGAG